MTPFDYLRPITLAEILDHTLANSAATYIAGGMTLLPTMKQRLASPELLVDLAGVPLLADIEDRDFDQRIAVGAMATHCQVNQNDLVQKFAPGIAELAGLIGDVQVRNRGTIGGSIANNDPAADYPAGVLACAATIETDRREIAADDFFIDMFETALEPGELIVNVLFPKGVTAKYCKFPHPVSGYAMAGVCIAKHSDHIRVAVTGAGPAVFRLKALEAALEKQFAEASVSQTAIEHEQLMTDIHADSRYRAQLIKVMAKKAVRAMRAAGL